MSLSKLHKYDISDYEYVLYDLFSGRRHLQECDIHGEMNGRNVRRGRKVRRLVIVESGLRMRKTRKGFVKRNQ